MCLVASRGCAFPSKVMAHPTPNMHLSTHSHSYVLGGGPAPPCLSNAALCDSRRTNRVRLGLVEEVDYVAVAPVVFYIFSLLYGLDDDDDSGSASEETPVIARFHTNVYGAECPPSVVKDVSRKAKQQAHVEVDRLMRRQHQFLLRSTSGSGMPRVPAGAAAAATLAPSLVSSCCSSSASLCPAAAAGAKQDESLVEAAQRKTPPLRFSLSMKHDDKEAEEEEEEEDGAEARRTPLCLQRVYGCCLLCIPASFYDYLGEKLGRPALGQQQPKAKQGEEESGAGMDRDDDIHSIISSSFSLRSLMEEDEEEGDDHELLLLWRNRQQQRQQQKSR